MTTATQKSIVQVDLERAARDRRMRLLNKSLDAVLTVFIYAVIAFVFFTPMLWALTSSFRTVEGVFNNLVPVSWKTFWPTDFMVTNYLDALGLTSSQYLQATPWARAFVAFWTNIGLHNGIEVNLGYNLGNNLWISLSSGMAVVFLSLIFNTSAAYFFGRLRFPGKPYILTYVLATMMVPQQIIMVPLFLVVKELGFINTWWALVLPWYASPFVTFGLTQFISDIPYELDEAAIMDGANLLQILFYVIVPMSVPGLVTMGLLEFQFIWNEFFWPLVATQNPKILPVQVAIASQFGQWSIPWGRVFASICLASVPVIVIFLSLQNFYYENIALTGLKG